MDSDDSSNEDADINEADRNIEGKFHKGLVSGWDDDNDGVEVEENPTETPEKEILWAAENGDENRVSELLAANSNLTKVTDKDGYTPLHRAAYNNHLRVVDVLLSYGADLNAVTLDKWTPLHSASHWNSAPCVGKLLLFDVNVNAQTEGGITPLHLAAQSSQSSETIQALLLHPNIDVKVKNNSDETAYDIAIRKGKLGKYFEIAEPCFNFI